MSDDVMPGHDETAQFEPNLECASASFDGVPAFRFDPAEYAHYVKDYELAEAQQRELLEAIWTVVVGFVDLGFGLHPVQQASDGAPDARHLAADSGSMLASFHVPSETNQRQKLRKARIGPDRERNES